MDEGLRKAYKYKLKPTPEQVRQLEEVLWRCRTLYNTALEQRITVYRQLRRHPHLLPTTSGVARPESGVP